MITSGEGEQAAASHKAGSVGALIAYVSPAAASHAYHHQPHGSVKAARLTPDNDDDGDGLGFWRWRSICLSILGWAAGISAAIIIGIIVGATVLRVFE